MNAWRSMAMGIGFTEIHHCFGQTRNWGGVPELVAGQPLS